MLGDGPKIDEKMSSTDEVVEELQETELMEAVLSAFPFLRSAPRDLLDWLESAVSM